MEGTIRAAKTNDVRVILVGDEGVIRRELNQHDGWRELPIEILHASERITMEDGAAKAARSRRNSSMHVACRLVSSGQANAFVSAGNTGACMAISKMVVVRFRASTVRPFPPFSDHYRTTRRLAGRRRQRGLLARNAGAFAVMGGTIRARC